MVQLKATQSDGAFVLHRDGVRNSFTVVGPFTVIVVFPRSCYGCVVSHVKSSNETHGRQKVPTMERRVLGLEKLGIGIWRCSDAAASHG